MRLAYLDASAILKLILDEAESAGLNRWYVETERVATSRVGVVEVRRAVAREGSDEGLRDRILSDLDVIELDGTIAAAAARVGPPTLRSLDAIHVATALALLPELDAFVTYDDRQVDAARLLGLPVIRPA